MGKKKSKNRKHKIKSKIPSKASTAAVIPPWIELPGDVTANILGRLGAEGILRSAQSVCTTWWKLCHEHPAMWRVVYLSCPNHEEQYTIMCRRAVDRSRGQLVDLTLDNFGDDQLIRYIAQRSSNLKRLMLNICFGVSGECLAEAVKKLPWLEELHLNIALRVRAVDIKNIVISCPHLKSCSFNRGGSWHQSSIVDDEGIGLAIAKSMPNLRHLELSGNHIGNLGLEAILNGCPHLESLDIEGCYGHDLGGDVVKRCRDRIKDLKLPTYSSDGFLLASEPISEWDSDDCYDNDDYGLSGYQHDYGYSSFDFEAYEGFNDFW